jgi:two-component system response regulator YesN
MNILLVDDEVLAINGLRAAVNWDKLGITNVHYAFNVPDAREIIRSQDINILICDIEMPGESGLDLLHWIKREHSSIVTILLTCHASFSYASEGIKSGILEYLLKPIDIDSLEETIQKAMDQIRKTLDYSDKIKYERLWSKNKELIKERFWLDIVTGIYQNSDYSYIEWTADLRSVELSTPITYLPILISIVSYEQYIKEEALLSYSIKNVISELILQNQNSIPVITLSKVEYLVLLPLSAQETYSNLQKQCRNFESSCFKYLKISVQTNQGVPVALCDLAKQVQTLRNYSTNLLSSTLIGNSPTMTVVDKIKEIVHKNVNHIITRESIGKVIFLNPDYLSKLFRKETGLALSDYIAKVKVEEAKRLLKNTNKSIGEIAAELGYTNFSYFSKMFKLETDSTPNQFRQLCKQDESAS